MLSPTCTDRMLLATAITMLRMDRPIINKAMSGNDNRLVMCLNALVDDALDQERDRQVHDDQRGKQDQGNGGAPRVRFDEGKEFFDFGKHA